MPSEIYLVKVGMTMTEGVVEEWYVADGDSVSEGEMLYRLETEKINMDVDAESSGTVRHLVAEGITCAPGDVVGYIYGQGEEIPAVLPQPATGGVADQADAAASAAVAAEAQTPAAPSREGQRVPASPAARKLAAELGVDLTALTGTGPRGRITEADVRAAGQPEPAFEERRFPPSSPSARRLASELGVDLFQVSGTGPRGRITEDDVKRAAEAPASREPEQQQAGAILPESRPVPVKGMRRVIAQRMYDSLQTSAQLTMEMEACMDDAVRLREQLIAEWQGEGIRPTYTDLVIRAAVRALEEHPMMNSVFADQQILMYQTISIGMAVALDEGLVVPVIRGADRLGLREIAVESARLAAAAREGTLGMDDYAGGTFTVSALGMFGVDSFTPIINMPQAGILGVNRIYDGVGWDNDFPLKRKMMRLSLTWDHRVLDGAPAARFLKSVCDLLEAPYRLLL